MKRLIMVVALLGTGLLGWNLPAEAGRVPTPGSVVAVVAPYGTVTYYNEWFYGGETATAVVAGNGSTMLSVTVYDEYGNVITSDSGYTCMLTWSPVWTGPFTITVTNLGADYNSYALQTN